MRILRFRRFWALTAVLVVVLCTSAWAAFFRPDVRPGYGVTRLGWLSDYHAPLRGTHLDAPVYYIEGEKAGATMLILGGAHPRELAGHVAALIAVENARAVEGRLIVVPALNASGYGIRDLATNIPRFHKVECRSGFRYLPFGDRRVDVADQGPDPVQYKHQSGAIIPNSRGKDGNEMRNINRCYPGLPDGTPTQQAAYAVMELVRKENVGLAVDMHEADTPSWYLSRKTGEVRQGGRLAYMLVCNPKEKAMEMGAEAVMNVGANLGMELKMEPSNRAFRGLSHLEIGDATDCLSFLFETPTPALDDWRENPDILTDRTYPIEHRAGLHQEVFQELVRLYNESHEERLVLEGLPTYQVLVEQGIAAWLN